MTPHPEKALLQTRRRFFGQTGTGVATAALASLLKPELFAAGSREPARNAIGGLKDLPHYAAKAKRVIYLFQSGGPAQMDLYDPKPDLIKRYGEEVPKSVYPDERKTTMTSGQVSFPVAPSRYKFNRCGQSGIELSETLPELSRMADDICVIRSMHTEAINHDPAATFFQTGSVVPGRPSMGSWLNYGLGSENGELPSFVALTSGNGGQPLYDRLWGNGFLPGRFQGVKFRGQGDPILDLYNPDGVSQAMRRRMLDSVSRLNELQFQQSGAPEIQTRIAQYELAYRMQASVPELIDFKSEPQDQIELYGSDVKKTGSYAYNCLLARRLAERGVRFIQLFHRGWDHHRNLPNRMGALTRATDQPTAALLHDLKQRGMLDDTLVVWGGEFGRTVYCQGKLSEQTYGRDHHPNCFSMWLAGAGVKGGMTYGATDDYSVNVAANGVHVHDMQATILHLLGINHELLTFRHQGRYYRLTDVFGKVINEILT
jgi:uncharacterized protein (DUF1501 family)